MERDPYKMIQFADDITEYSESMKKVCSDMKNNIDSARPFMKDEASQKAFQRIEAFAENLLGSLSEAHRAEEKLRESAKYLIQALEVARGI